MKTEIYIFNLNGNRAVIRDYANTIASMNVSFCNAYVMAFDKDNEILWTIQAGDDLDEVKAAINWQGVRRVEIYDHSADGTYKIEQVYITSRKSLTEYTSERSAFEFVVISNTTQYTAENWQTVENDNNDTQSNDSNEGNQTPAEPSRLAQTAAKGSRKRQDIRSQGRKACRSPPLAPRRSHPCIFCRVRLCGGLARDLRRFRYHGKRALLSLSPRHVWPCA